MQAKEPVRKLKDRTSLETFLLIPFAFRWFFFFTSAPANVPGEYHSEDFMPRLLLMNGRWCWQSCEWNGGLLSFMLQVKSLIVTLRARCKLS